MARAVRYRDLKLLKAAVLAEAERWFETTFGMPWREHVLPDHHVEIEARKLFDDFRSAYIALRTYVKRADGRGGQCANLVWHELRPRLDDLQPIAMPPKWRPLHGRLYLIALVEVLQKMIARPLLPKERAIISLLLNSWPDKFTSAIVAKRGALVSEIIDAERRNISQAVRRENLRKKRSK